MNPEILPNQGHNLKYVRDVVDKANELKYRKKYSDLQDRSRGHRVDQVEMQIMAGCADIKNIEKMEGNIL